MSAAGTFTSTGRAIEAAPTPSTFMDPARWKGKIRVMRDQAFWSGTSLGQNSTMAFGILPKGALPLLTIIQPIASTGVPTVTSNAVTGTVGLLAGATESADLDCLGTYTTLAASGAPAQILQPVPDGTVYGGVTPLNEDRQVSVKHTGAIEGVAGEGISLTIIYGVSD